MTKLWVAGTLLLACLLSITMVAAQLGEDTEEALQNIRARTWTKYITMRDGVKLHTRFVAPRDWSESGEKLTVVMDRSPYGQFALELLADLFVPAGELSPSEHLIPFINSCPHTGTNKTE
jgi:hypothetical protein